MEPTVISGMGSVARAEACTKRHVVREAIVIDGKLIEIGPEKRFGSIQEILDFYERYPKVKRILSGETTAK